MGAVARSLDPLWAIVPVKALATVKQRLAPALSIAARQELVRGWLVHVLQTLQVSGVVDHVLVVSGDPAVGLLATRYGAEALAEAGNGGLNAALAQATAYARAHGAAATLVIPADLPGLTPQDVAALCAAARALPGTGVVLAASRDGQGTNALLCWPPEAIPPAFGPGSFQRHRAAARSRDLCVVVLDRPGLAFDIDTPDDLREWLS